MKIVQELSRKSRFFANSARSFPRISSGIFREFFLEFLKKTYTSSPGIYYIYFFFPAIPPEVFQEYILEFPGNFPRILGGISSSRSSMRILIRNAWMNFRGAPGGIAGKLLGEFPEISWKNSWKNSRKNSREAHGNIIAKLSDKILRNSKTFYLGYPGGIPKEHL